MEISGLDDYLHLSDAGYLWMVQCMWSPVSYTHLDVYKRQRNSDTAEQSDSVFQFLCIIKCEEETGEILY